ncbi:GNAT family N-acetyltransferase [Curtobacterium sp. RRHDQ10]|uniref:GNAT family N-acetyltransferase n=1 Tax=Curtobacterium phyllosphaerae TaxID=3413379 RepID=UPI003BF3404C
MHTATPSDLRWTVVPEGELGLPDHEAIAGMLAQVHPDDDHWFIGARSWSGMQPERRILATTEDDVVVAHLGIRRLFVTVGGRDLLVGAVGLVGVAPRWQGNGIGRELLRRAADELAALRVPFGLLGTGEDRIPFYGAAGWRLLDTVSTSSSSSSEGVGLTIVDDEGWLALPVAAPFEDWPAGDLHWNAQQV